MTDRPAFWIAIALSGVVTYTVRAVLLLLAGRLTDLPPVVAAALRMIPAAALAALAIPAILRPDGASESIQLLSPELLAGVLAGAVAAWSRNLLATIAVGLVAVVVLERIVG